MHVSARFKKSGHLPVSGGPHGADVPACVNSVASNPEHTHGLSQGIMN